MSENRSDNQKGQMASTEVAGKGEFFLYNDISKDRKYGFSGGIWVIEPEAADELAQGGIEAVLKDPQLRNNVALFVMAQERVGVTPGLHVDFYNNPLFKNDSDLKWE